jgi:hypothetical protein
VLPSFVMHDRPIAEVDLENVQPWLPEKGAKRGRRPAEKNANPRSHPLESLLMDGYPSRILRHSVFYPELRHLRGIWP